MSDTPCCEYQEFVCFHTERERIEAMYEGCAWSDINEDDDRMAEQEEDTSRFLLDVAIACEGDLTVLGA